MFHVPAHKNISHPAGQVDYSFRALRFAAEEAAFRAKWTREDDALFDDVNADIFAPMYDAAKLDQWCNTVNDTPYNNRDCDVMCRIGPKAVDVMWPLFSQSVGYDISAIEHLPAGSTLRSMFAENGMSVDGKTYLGLRTVHDRTFQRD